MSSRPPCVSVIIPTYNRADLLREALESVVTQTFKETEVIVVDDGSDDSTPDVLHEFEGRIQAVRLSHAGISAARNAGMDRATGEYLAFLDSDDLWKPEKLERQLRFAEQHPECVLTYCDAHQFSSEGVDPKSFVERFPALRKPADIFVPMIRQYAIPLTSTVMVKTSFLKETGIRFPIEIGSGEDLGMFLHMLLAGAKFEYLPESLALRRLHEANVSGEHCPRFRNRKLLYENMFRTVASNMNAEQRAAVRLGLRDAGFRTAECDWEEGHYLAARKGFFASLGCDKRGLAALAYGMVTFLPSSWIAGVRSLKSDRAVANY